MLMQLPSPPSPAPPATQKAELITHRFDTHAHAHVRFLSRARALLAVLFAVSFGGLVVRGRQVSHDDGVSWTALKLLWSESNATHHVAIHNPTPVVTGGKVLVVFNRNSRDCLTLRSLDGSGLAWEEEPVDITAQLTNASGSLTTGPPQGLVLPSGRIVVAAGGSSIQGGRAIYSDDGGAGWAISGLANPKGGEAQVALAPNGSLLLNSRGPAQGVRWQSASADDGATWSAPRVLDFGFGSSCEGSIIAVPGTDLLLFSHAGRIGTGESSGRVQRLRHLSVNVKFPEGL